MTMNTIDTVDLGGKRVLLREDFNVPIENGAIVNDERIRRALPTIRTLLERGAAVAIISHLGRPTAGERDVGFSLQCVADRLSELLGTTVNFVPDWIETIPFSPGQVVLCENVRFLQGEAENQLALAQQMAALCDIFVMDAFATIHRQAASTLGLAQQAPYACAGPLVIEELSAIDKAMNQAATPVLAIVGGAKVSTKLTMLEALLDKVDAMILGGGIANTFLAAQGHAIGNSLVEIDLIPVATQILQAATRKGIEIHLPDDVAVAKTFSVDSQAEYKAMDAIVADDMILDIGQQTAQRYRTCCLSAGTIIWNGPVGVFEFDAFAYGTGEIASAIADSDAYSLAGGGDTIAAIDKFQVRSAIGYISTGGGAFLHYIEGRTLPVLDALKG